MSITNNKDLAQAVNNQQSEIIIEGDLAKKIIKIKATGKVAWAIAIGAIGVAVAAVMAAPLTAGTSGVVSAIAAPGAVAVLGGPAAATAIGVAIAGGGIATLNKLRVYKVVSRSDNRIVLKRK